MAHQHSVLLKVCFYFDNNFLYELSTHIAPNGAVSKIDTTATVKTISPQSNPIAIGIVPMAACTVALGVYAIHKPYLFFNVDKS